MLCVFSAFSMSITAACLSRVHGVDKLPACVAYFTSTPALNNESLSETSGRQEVVAT